MERVPATPRRARRTALAVVAFTLLLTAACTSDDGSSGAPSEEGSATPTSLAVPDLVQEVAPAVVAIEVSTPEGAGQGSGAILEGDGLVVTNDHVVSSAERVVVVLADGSREPAEVVATDAYTDLALVRIDRSGLPAVELADELPPIGAPVVSIGNPLGFENTVTAGIVSGLQRSIPQAAARGEQALVDLIQTDAAISPGSSGGVLVGADGRIVGINVAYLPPQSGAVSLGFAIPAPTVEDVVADLLDDGRAEHPYLGVQLAAVTPQLAERFELSARRGVLAAAVEAGGPAADGGLQEGDVITALDGTDVGSVGAFLTQLRRVDPGDAVQLTVVRSGEEATLTIEVGERPPADAG